MRRLTIWILVLALILLALCALWFLPRLLHEEPLPPESGLAATEVPGAGGTTGGDGGSTPPLPLPTDTTAAADARGPAGADADETPAAEDEAIPPGSIRGRLVDRAGRTVEGADVFAAHAPDPGMPIERAQWWISYLPLDVADPAALGAGTRTRGTSDAAGRFHLADVEPGRVRFAVRSRKLAPLDRNDLRLAAGQDLDLGDVALDPPSEVYGRVEDAEGLAVSDVPLIQDDDFADASLPALDPSLGIELDVTDDRGRFRTPPIGPGPWSLRAVGGRSLSDVVLRGNTPTDGWNVVGTMPEAVAISGRVATRGRLADGLVVRALPAEAPRSAVPFACRADARLAPVQRNGEFQIEGLAEGVLYELRAGLLGERFEDESLWSTPALVTAPDAAARVGWEPDADVHFELIDGRDRSAVAMCELTLESALPAHAVLGPPAADQHGLRTLGGVKPRRTLDTAPSLLLASRGFQPILQRLDLRPGSGTSLGALTMNRLPEVQVRVVDARTGSPVPGALVTATEIATGRDASGLAPLAVATDAAGEARVPSFGGAGSRIEVRARGRASARRIGPFGGGFTPPSIEIRLSRGATARIQVVDADGRAVPAERVEWIAGNWSPNEDATDLVSRIADADGRVAFAHLAPGRHAFRVQRYRAWLDGEWTQRELGEGEELDIALESFARTSVDVRVSDGGVPLSGVHAVLVRRSSVASLFEIAGIEHPLPPGVAAHLDARGAWRFQNVDPGAYVLALDVAGQGLRACRELNVRPGSNVLALDLVQTAVAGRIADGAGQSIPGAEILVVDAASERDLRNLARRRGGSGSTPAALGLEPVACTADENGLFRLIGLPVGEAFTILARAGDFALGRSGLVEVHAGAVPEDLAIALVPAGALEIQVSTAPVAFACTILAFPQDRRALPRVQKVFPGRREFLRALEPGLWEIELGYEGLRGRDRRRIEIVAGETGTVDLSLP